jgi:hypothetical protein
MSSSSVIESIRFVLATIFRCHRRPHSVRAAGNQAPQNPHPFGTRGWRIFAEAQAPAHERMMLRIADLEAQVQQTTELLGSLEALAVFQDSVIHDLKLRNKALEDGPDPEVLQRILDKIHTPLKKPSQPGGPVGLEPQPAEPESSVTSCAPVASAVVGPTQTSGCSTGPSQEITTGHIPGPRTRPVTLAEELEGHVGEDAQHESEAGDVM